MTNEKLHTSPFRRTAAVMRDGGHIANHPHFDASGRERANRRLPSRSGTAHAHIHRAHTLIARLISGVHCRLLRRERSSLSGTTEAQRTGTLPGHHLPLIVSNGDDGVVERGLNVRQSRWHILALLFFYLLFLGCSFFSVRRAAGFVFCYAFLSLFLCSFFSFL